MALLGAVGAAVAAFHLFLLVLQVNWLLPCLAFSSSVVVMCLTSGLFQSHPSALLGQGCWTQPVVAFLGFSGEGIMEVAVGACFSLISVGAFLFVVDSSCSCSVTVRRGTRLVRTIDSPNGLSGKTFLCANFSDIS